MKPIRFLLIAVLCIALTKISSAQISGTVFVDINGNGLKTAAAPIEPGIAGITINVYDNANVLRGTATSVAAGTYSITPTGAAPYRVEFTIPVALTGYEESPGGVNYSSSIQFVSSATQANVNFAIINSEFFSSTQDPRVAVPQHIPGNPLGGGTSGTDNSLRSMMYSSTGTTLTNLQNNATAAQIGATWGLAWDKLSKKLFSAAFVRRHSGLGPQGPGGIYVTNFASGTGVTTNLMDVDAVPGIDLGAVPLNGARSLNINSNGLNSIDAPVFGLVGKVGLGDMDIDMNQKKLYIVNLNERNIIVIDIANYLANGTLPTATEVSELAITGMPTATNGVARPFALKIFRDKLYIGITNTAEFDLASATAANMSMTVVSLDLIANTWATPISGSTLNYLHGEPQVGGGQSNHPWSDATDAAAARANGNGWVASLGGSYGPGNFYFSSRVSPWLTDIEFDIDGSMVLGLSDRGGFQFGGFQPHPTVTLDIIDFRTGGDILRFYNNSGTFVREAAGTTLGGGGCAGGSAPPEYYCGENFNGNAGHAENSGGALAFLPGSGEMTETAMDPAANIWANGIQKMNNTTGAKSGTSFEIYAGAGASNFAKSGGLGDVELLLDVAPIQVGNRIWNDKNGNGIQDADEIGIASLTVTLVSPGADGDYATVADNQTWTTTTAPDGTYYFSTLNMVAADTRKPAGWAGITTGILPGYNYRIQITIPTGVLLTVADASGNTIDRIDNDATQLGALAIILVNTTVTNNSYDIGLVYASLGNKVWRDDNGDGEQNANEPGVSGVAVGLYTNGTDNLPGTADDILIASTLTDANGNYLFENLIAGDYHIKVTPPANYKFTTQGAGADAGTATDCDVDGLGVSKTIALNPGEKELNVDAGIVPTTQAILSSIGDRVWFDIDGDGVQDANEPGVSGVTVTLYDGTGNILAIIKTNANGNYIFNNLPNGTYTIGVSAPGGTVLTTSGGTTAGNNNDSDINPVTGKSAPIVISTAGTVITGIDAGIKNDTKAVLGDYVWNDINRDGIQQSTEQGIPNVVMELYAAGPDNAVGGGDDIFIGTTTTDALGYYVFNNLNPAKYFVVATPPVGYVVTLPNIVAGNPALDTKDNDFVIGAAPYLTKYVSGIYDLPTTVVKIPRDMTVDLGLYRNVAINTLNSISNFVWNDINENGVQDAGETGVANVTVRLLNGAGAAFNNPSTGQPYVLTTDVNGNYQFIDLPDGNYIVEFANIPAGYNLTGANTAPGVANNDLTDNDADPVTGRTGIIALDPTSVIVASVNNTTVDAGIKSTPAGAASLGDRVWYDLNNNGAQDATESGVSSIRAELLDGTGAAVNVAGTSTPYVVTTNAIGEYLFTNLVAGTYQVRFSNFPFGFTSSVANNVINNDVTDADANFAGAAIATTTATTANYSLTTGEEDLTVDMGIVPPAGRNSTGNYVWLDANGDGVQGAIATEPGVKGVNVTLYNNGVDALPNTSDDVFVKTTTTDENGFYLFAGLLDGNYNIGFSNIPNGLSFTAKEAVAGATGSDADRFNGRTGTIALDPTSISAASVNNVDIDAGLITTKAMLGDYVWLDANSNGTQDATEKPISGVTVTLYDVSNNPIATTITDKNGKYLFTNLNPGTYTVGFTNYPPSLEFTTQEAVAGSTGSDVNPATGLTAAITLIAGQVNVNIDAGLKPKNPASVGDYVWIDVDRNASQGSAEPGLPGIIVTLYNAANNVVGSAVTNGDGLYRITNVTPAAGYYIIFSNLPDSSFFTTQTSNVTTTDATLGSDANVIGVPGKTASFPLIAGQYLPHVDAGIFKAVPLAKLGNRVWKDDNIDGLQTAGEPGVAGINVQLYRNGTDQLANTADDVFVGSTVTDAYGYYIFERLDSTVTTTAATTAQTSYNVKFTLPANYVFTTATTPGDNANNTNSDANVSTGRTTGYVLNPGESDTTVDAGIVFAQAITQNVGDRVWLDINQNGVQDPTENGVSGVTVTLYNSAGVAIASTITNSGGNYLFQNVPIGINYKVGFTLPPGMVFSDKDLGGNDNLDSDADNVTASPTFGKTPAFNVIAGTDNLTLDAGIYPQSNLLASIGDKVWNDVNRDNLQTAGEPGVEAVKVYLWNNGRTVKLDSTVTDAFGYYVFNNLSPNTYSLQFALPATFSRVAINTGANDFIDSDDTTATGFTAPYILAAGERNMSVDAGIFKTVAIPQSLGDRVWYDTNNDGLQTAGEPGVPGVTATLYTSANVAIDTTTTNASGFYRFADLTAGTYYVIFKNLPAGFTFTKRVSSADNQNNTNSDADSLGKTMNVAIAAAENDLTIDAGIITGAPSGKGSLGDRVWYDMNNNGIQDAGETGVNGMLVYLSKDVNRDGVFTAGATEQLWDTTYTNATGNYLFTGLDSGYYQVRYLIPAGYTSVAQNAGSDDAIDSDGPVTAAGGTSVTATYALAQGEDNLSVDLGINKTVATNASLGNQVWFDANKDGIKDIAETGVPGVQATLYNATTNAVVVNTTTDNSGYYLFDNLAVGNYIVRFTNFPSGMYGTTQTTTITNNRSAGDSLTGYTPVITLIASQNRTDVDFGLQNSRAALGDYVWIDANGNGVQDATEKSVAGVTTTLYAADGATVISSMITNGEGKYYYPNLLAGTYIVGFTTTPDGLNFTQKVSSGDNGNNTNSDADLITGKTMQVILDSSEIDVTIDAGLYRPTASVGDFVWFDTNRDGKQTAGEPGVPGVIATLYNSSNQPIGSAITDGNGAYLITNLPSGTGYYVVFSNLPPNNSFTTVGNAIDIDNSKANPANGKTTTFSLADAQQVTNIDAGLVVLTSALGNRVWRDDNKDGLQTAGEPGVAGINVTLSRNGTDQLPGTADDVLVSSTVTDAYGKYMFNALTATDTTTATTTAQTSYNIKFALPANYVFTTQTGTADDQNDTNSDASVLSGITTVGYKLSPGETDSTIDAGIIFPEPITQCLGNKIWLDANNNGIENAGEPGMASVTVSLYYDANNDGDVNDAGENVPYLTAVTDANGNYQFCNIPVGNYAVAVTKPAGFTNSPLNQGGGNQTLGNVAENGTDSDIDPATEKTGIINLSAGEILTNVDGGLVPTLNTRASLGDRVWNDINQDGIQNAGETGVSGVTITLYDSLGTTMLATTTTDAFGNYMFTNLPGTVSYVVGITTPAGYTNSPKNQGPDRNVDSNGDPVTGKTDPKLLTPGARVVSVDFGIYLTAPAGTAKLGDVVWFDINKNGVQNPTEPGIAGVTATLYTNGVDGLPGTADDAVVKSTTTNAIGYYQFTDLAAANYNVGFSNIPAGYALTISNVAGDNANNTNSDANPSTGRTPSYTLTAGESDQTIDAGLIAGTPSGKGSLGNKVWFDINVNGIQDGNNETGVRGVTVTLQKDINNDGDFADAGEPNFATQITNSLGEYLFTGLDASVYRIQFSTLPGGYQTSPQNTGTIDEVDSDGGTPSAGISTTGVYNLAQGEDNLSVDLGINKTSAVNGSISDKVFFDTNTNGVRDANEPGIAGVTVTLYNATGGIIMVTTTDMNGNYLFDNLIPANYYIGFSNYPAGLSPTTQNATITNDNSAGDANTGITFVVTLASGQNRTDVDFGLSSARASLGNFVWIDSNGDGVQNAGEPGVPGVTVSLLFDANNDGDVLDGGENIPVTSMVTNQNGEYLFTNLLPGNYQVIFSTIPSGLSYTQQNTPGDNNDNTNSDVLTSTGTTGIYNLLVSEADLTVDGGLYKPTASVGNYVWYDVNLSGIQDATESGVGGVLVKLINTGLDNLPATADDITVSASVTDGNGAYLFTNVAPGNYFIQFSNIPDILTFTVRDQGTDNLDSDVNPADGTTPVFAVVQSSIDLTFDAGIIGIPNPLPILLTSFTGIANKCDAVLQWKTAQEINADKFVVEQSNDGLNFTAVAEVKSANSANGKSYQTSVSQATGLMYYRLKLLDRDGKFSYSSIVTVRTSCSSSDYLTVYPNPVSTNLTVSFVTAYRGQANLLILNAAGQQVATSKIQIITSANAINLNMSNYAPGTYMLYLENSNGEKIGQIQKVIKN